MPIRYYPASRVRTDLKTGGNQYTLNGVPYKGDYYLTYKGEAYTGRNPATGPNELLQPLVSDNGLRAALLQGGTRLSLTREVANTSKGVVREAPSLKQLISYYPIPLESDYERGYFSRYFAKKVNMSGYILEISYDQYVGVTQVNDPTYEDYEAISIFWQLKGPRNDVRVSQYEIRGGVYDTNKRVTEKAAKGFNGLVEFIGGDYTKFARIE